MRRRQQHLSADLQGTSGRGRARTGRMPGVTLGVAALLVVVATAGGSSSTAAAQADATPQTLVSIEFDDGPQTQWAVRQTLAAHGVHATFFVNSGLIPDYDGGWRMSWSQL